MDKVFRVEYPIRFSHCDPAGQVYFPRFFDLLHDAMEDWFTHGLGERFADFLMEKKLGTPTVGTQCDFLSPARFGDTLAIELSIARLGNSSVELLFNASVGGRACLRCRHTICIFSKETVKAVPIPEDLRARMLQYVAQGKA
ncbi:MAG TPA: thioesterase family protein [Burkholderiales bacterium]|nr:thioesterase family protein [Burkholderiales bacterium]